MRNMRGQQERKKMWFVWGPQTWVMGFGGFFFVFGGGEYTFFFLKPQKLVGFSTAPPRVRTPNNQRGGVKWGLLRESGVGGWSFGRRVAVNDGRKEL